MTSEKRSAATPDIPAMAELPGFAGYSFTNWTGVFMAAKTPPAVIERLIGRNRPHREGARDPRQAARRRRRARWAFSTADVVKFFAREKATYSKIAKTRNIKADD